MSGSIWDEDEVTKDAIDAVLARAADRGSVEAALRAWLPGQRWFRAKSRELASVHVVDDACLGDARFAVLEASFVDGGPPEHYTAVFGVARGREGDGVEVARSPEGELTDALAREDVLLALLDGIARGSMIPTRRGGALRFEAYRSFDSPEGPAATRPARLMAAEQSNTSIRYGDRWFMKLLRRLDEGASADLEVSRFLAERFAHTPTLAGAIAYVLPGATDPPTVALLYRFLPSKGEGWEIALGEARASLAADRADVLSAFAARLGRLGQRTAELHRALASEPDDPAFAPEPFDAAARAAFAAAARVDLARTFDELEGHAVGASLAPLRQSAEARLDALARVADGGLRTRVHGDYHLGQVLAVGEAGDDFAILDFEGEPARALAERKAKRSPLADVAGLLRSLHYAAMSALRGGDAATPERTARAEQWASSAQGAYLEAYLASMSGAGVLPAGRDDIAVVLDAHLLDKCLYELRYELDNRPDWIDIPAAGLRALLCARQ